MLIKIILLPFYIFFIVNKYYSKILKKFNLNYTKWHDINIRYFFTTIKSIKFLHKNQNVEIKFFIPNTRCLNRVDAIFSKEPDTINWINNIDDNAVFYDIGSNIGIYSIYFSSINKGNFVCFEPLQLNANEIIRNINLNNLQQRAVVCTNPLSKDNEIQNFSILKQDIGSSGNVLIKNKIDSSISSFQTFVFNLDFLHDQNILKEVPGAIKIDIDGKEELVLQGGRKILSNNKCKTVLVECINKNNDIDILMKNYGFKKKYNLYEKITYNHIYIK